MISTPLTIFILSTSSHFLANSSSYLAYDHVDHLPVSNKKCCWETPYQKNKSCFVTIGFDLNCSNPSNDAARGIAFFLPPAVRFKSSFLTSSSIDCLDTIFLSKWISSIAASSSGLRCLEYDLRLQTMSSLKFSLHCLNTEWERLCLQKDWVTPHWSA